MNIDDFPPPLMDAMDVDEEPQAPREPKRRCFCCGKKYGTRQLSRHLRAFLDRLNDQLDIAEAAVNREGVDYDDADPGGNDMGVGDAAMEEEGAVWDFGEGKYVFGCERYELIVFHL
jgi:hypothetical protein